MGVSNIVGVLCFNNYHNFANILIVNIYEHNDSFKN
jgi:hypothetical protein